MSSTRHSLVTMTSIPRGKPDNENAASGGTGGALYVGKSGPTEVARAKAKPLVPVDLALCQPVGPGWKAKQYHPASRTTLHFHPR